MASCNVSTYSNIKNLPQIFNVVGGDFLIIENPQGTNIIDYKDIRWDINNMSFASLLSSNEDRVTVLDTRIKSLTTADVSLRSDITTLSSILKSTYRVENRSNKTLILMLSDAYSYIRLTNTNSNQIWLTKQRWPSGAEITFRRARGAGAVDILTEEGVVINDDVSTNVTEGNTFMIKHLSNNEWDFI